MILEALFGLSLIVNASLDNRAPSASDPGTETRMSVRYKNAALLPLVRRATECIARKVAADQRYDEELRPGELNDLIVDAMSACERFLRSMIDTHDRMYGHGSGEAFMLGPYLDVLPAAVVKQVKVKTPAQ
jgi:hypothetical protein